MKSKTPGEGFIRSFTVCGYSRGYHWRGSVKYNKCKRLLTYRETYLY